MVVGYVCRRFILVIAPITKGNFIFSKLTNVSFSQTALTHTHTHTPNKSNDINKKNNNKKISVKKRPKRRSTSGFEGLSHFSHFFFTPKMVAKKYLKKKKLVQQVFSFSLEGKKKKTLETLLCVLRYQSLPKKIKKQEENE